ncbi:MAG: hypothetical protein WCP33_03090 [Deltaproteobacteria bacterium]
MATINDIVLINVNNKPGFYARIEDITPDVKPGWWQVQLLILTFPLQVFNWILDEYQLEGADFTMGGTPLRMDPIVTPVEEDHLKRELEEKEQLKQTSKKGDAHKVVSLMDRRKK